MLSGPAPNPPAGTTDPARATNAPSAGRAVVTGRVGYLAQDAYLFDTTVAENVRIGRRDATDAETAAALARARVAMPVDRLVGRHGAAVSGGEARRIACPAAGGRRERADPGRADRAPGRAHRGRLIDDLWATAEACRAAVLVITHDPVLAARCDRVVTLPTRSTDAAPY